ncbi:MAG: hypothetical protein B6244_08900 [Candidatus Cloacimonetes bacterium 4572_55]|nr:MAG: hypothetical protein B6244_08900 [Candidatus Cloacimonetes bacterium 4572_55]
MRRYSIVSLLLFGFIFFSIRNGSANTKAGANAAQFLKIGIGARAAAMGGSFAALADDATTLYWNPAGAGWLRDKQFVFSYTESFAEINHGYAAAILPFSDATTIGVSLTTLYAPEMEQTTVEFPGGTGVNFDARDVAIGLTYARRMTDRFSFGFTAKYVQQTLFNESAETVAFDVGGLLHTDFRGMRIGMGMCNFGGKMSPDGRDLLISYDDQLTHSNPLTPGKLETQGWSLPMIFRLGLAVEAVGGERSFVPHEDQKLIVTIDGYHVNDADETLSFGLEYGWREMLFLRGGNRLNHDTETFSLGFGIALDLIRHKIRFDYSYSDMSDLGNLQRFGAGLLF